MSETTETQIELASPDEQQRLEMLRSLDVVDRPVEAFFGLYAALASQIAQTPIAVVSLVDAHRLWFAGRVGLAATETPRAGSFCHQVISGVEELIWVEDARRDPRFDSHPLVIADPQVRFYAGVRLVVNGWAVGTLSVLGPDVRPYDPDLADRLTHMAALLAERLEKKHKDNALRRALEVTSDAIIECDDLGVITGWRHGAEQLFGYTEAEALGRRITLIVPESKRRAHLAGFQRWRESGVARWGRRLELEAVRKDGTQVDIELCMSLWHALGRRQITSSIRDISQRTALAGSLIKAKTDAEAANVAKSAFLANMSHEIRTPLNGVVGVVDLLSATPLTPHQTELTSIIRASSQQLQGVLGDILDLARVESGQLALSEEAFSVEALVAAVAELCALRAAEKGLQLGFTVDETARNPVLGDPVRLKQVLLNLLSNAVKFTDAGSVRISVSAEAGIYRFEVRDTGVGFTEDQRAAIFNRFHQADGSITRRFGGAGLGLAISRDLVTAMNGQIDCRATPGAGATFWFTVPLAAAATVTAPASAATDPHTGPFGAVRVLLADDNATNRRVVELILASAGAEIVSVENGAAALDAFDREPFDIVLMDMMMPVMDGVVAVRHIRDRERGRGAAPTPVIMLTANTLPEHVDLSLGAGADFHLPKPINARALLQAIARAMSQPSPDGPAPATRPDRVA